MSLFGDGCKPFCDYCIFFVDVWVFCNYALADGSNDKHCFIIVFSFDINDIAGSFSSECSAVVSSVAGERRKKADFIVDVVACKCLSYFGKMFDIADGSKFLTVEYGNHNFLLLDSRVKFTRDESYEVDKVIYSGTLFLFRRIAKLCVWA